MRGEVVSRKVRGRHEINWRTPDSIGEVRMRYEGLGRPLLRPLKPKRSIMYQFDVAAAYPHCTIADPTRYGARVLREKKWVLPS